MTGYGTGRAVLCHASSPHSDRGAPCCSTGVAWLAPRNRSLFPGGVDKARIEELRCWRNRHGEITPLNKRVGHALVALRANPPIGAEGAKLANEVVIGIGGILTILLGILHQDIHRLILVFRIVEPVHCTAICPDIAQQRLAI